MSVIAIATIGTLGDLFPFFQLGSELKKRGHTVIFATSKLYQPQTEELGFSFFPLRPDLADIGASVSEVGKQVMDPHKGPEFMFKKMIVPYIQQSYEDVNQLADRADVLITHPLVLTASLVAEKKSTKWITVVLSPISLFSVYDPPVLSVNFITRRWRPGPALSRLILKLVKRKLASWAKPLDQLRHNVGLPPNPYALTTGQHSPQGSIALFSPAYAAPQADWPQNMQATGFLFHDQHTDGGRLPEVLTRFLQAGPPPVVFTLGSAAVFRAGTFYEESIQAAIQLKCRAVILTGIMANEHVKEQTLPDHILVLEYASFSLLFPHAAAVVHHGGIGTTAQALRAGVPTLVVPHAHDQPDNALRVKRTGTGEVLNPPKYKSSNIVKVLNQLLTNSTYKQHAVRIAEALQQEDAGANACVYIEKVLGS